MHLILESTPFRTDDEGDEHSCQHTDFSMKDYSARWILKQVKQGI